MTRGGLFKPVQEPDRLALKKLFALATSALIAFALGVGWSVIILRKHDGGRMIPELSKPMPAQLGQAKFGMVDQWLFEGDGRYRSQLDAQRWRLETYGWIDRQKGIVHVPIGEAMRRVAQHGDQLQRPAPPRPSPAQPGPTPAESPEERR